LGFYENDQKYVMNTYNKTPIEIIDGEGVYVTDIQGHRYLDMFGGIAVNVLGHKNKKILDAVNCQASRYIHLSNYFASEPTVQLAKLLVENTFAEKVFFTNSGTEANEAAIKIGRKYGRSISPDKTKILSADNSFHGRTCGSLAITGQKKYQEPFEPLLPNVYNFEFNNIESFKQVVDDQVCAVFIEAIQGEGGIVEVEETFMQEVKALSIQHDFLLIVDEIQAGIGRTGKFLSYENYGVMPDIVTLAKALGGGFPIGAVLAGEKAAAVLKPGDHGTTFGPNPVASAVGCVVVNEVLNETFLSEVHDKGCYIKNKIENLKKQYPDIISEIRGTGLMLGINTGKYAGPIKEMAFERKMLLNVTAGDIVRIVPALNITYDEINQFVATFTEILAEVAQQK
jgi:acetylornithine/N-succinyldiaminopimelate aminotransferase